MEQLNDFCVQNNFTEIWRFIVASEEFLEKHLEIIKWKRYCSNPNINLEFISKHLNLIEWKQYCSNPNINLEFISNHLDKVKWKELCSNLSVDINFLEKYPQNIHWSTYCSRNNLNLEFLVKHLDKVCWFILLNNKTVPISFIEEHCDPKTLYTIANSKRCQRLPDSYFKIKNVNIFNFCYAKNVPNFYLEKYIFPYGKTLWSEIDFNDSEKMQFLTENLDKVDWSYLSKNVTLPIEFFDLYADKINWDKNHFLINPSIPEWFFEKYYLQGKFKLDDLIRNKNISFKFFQKYSNIWQLIEWSLYGHLNVKSWFLINYQSQIEQHPRRFIYSTAGLGSFDVSYNCKLKMKLFNKFFIDPKRSIFLKNSEERIKILKIDF